MKTVKKEKKLIYFINAFNRGGAEKGLLELVRHGAFNNCKIQVVAIILGQGAYINDLRAAGADVSVLFNSDKMKMIHWLLSFFLFAYRIARFRPDFAVLSLPQANIAGRLAAIPFPRLNILSFEHNTRLAKPIYETLFRLTSWRVNWLLADCQATANSVKRNLYRSEPKHVQILPLVALEKIGSQVGRQKSTSISQFKIVNAGRFTPVKNQLILIEALNILRKQNYNVVLGLYGEGELKETCMCRVQELKLDNYVEFPGFLSDWMHQPADAFVLASKHEGLCIVAIEAMANGLPVIAPRVGGLLDYGEMANTMFIDDVTPQDLANAVEYLMEHEDIRQQMSNSGIKAVRDNYSVDMVRKIYQSFSDQLIEAT